MFTTCVTKNNTRDYFSLSKSSRRRWVVVVVGGRENWNRCCATTPRRRLTTTTTTIGGFFVCWRIPEHHAVSSLGFVCSRRGRARRRRFLLLRMMRFDFAERRGEPFSVETIGELFARSWSKVKVWVSLESAAAAMGPPWKRRRERGARRSRKRRALPTPSTAISRSVVENAARRRSKKA